MESDKAPAAASHSNRPGSGPETAEPPLAAKPEAMSPGRTGTPAAGQAVDVSKPASKPAGKVITPSKPSGAAAGKPAATTARRPALNVKDALSYLDQVKLRFEKQPEIYNRFLDIMKDFKTQVIDTPGVIDRVSSLFRNHPTLISGFNTFLPVGFRIECSIDPLDGGSINSITVITPTGTQHLAAGFATSLTGIKLPGQMEKDGSPSQPLVAPKPAALPVVVPEDLTSPPSEKAPAKQTDAFKQQDFEDKKLPDALPSNGLKSDAPSEVVKKQSGDASENIVPPNPSQPTPPLPISRTGTPNAASALSESRRPPIEFNHAISYVNKIKNRFIRDPDIYKSFLDILQTYQKEQRPIQDVYAQVTRLFKTAPDLLDEFKQFLPDHSQQGQQARDAIEDLESQPIQSNASRDIEKKLEVEQVPPPTLLPVGRGKAKPAAPPSIASDDIIPPPQIKRKRALPMDTIVSNTTTSAPAGLPPAPQAVKQKTGTRGKKNAAATTSDIDSIIPAQQSSARYDTGTDSLSNGYPHAILSYLPPGYTLPGTSPGTLALDPLPIAQETPEERIFFDRIADFIDDKFTYYEFLKLLNLYTQDIIDLPTLVSRAWLFIGSAPELWVDFREIVGWRDGISAEGRTIEDGEWIIENIPAVERKGPDLTKCEPFGPSYRRLPRSVGASSILPINAFAEECQSALQEMQMNCSGRDQLCWEVLNDEWVSVMSLGSEEVFLAHKKNPFEEALHRTEEERHEYDFHIEANLRTIALLEPIAARIAGMDSEERLTFRLKPGLGGQSKSIYQRIIKKVYGKELGREVIQALHENPCISVPIVLARLKQKDEEWKRALREWNRVWREVDAKNFYRSLDHQGITFKASDKRYIASKSLVNEIETLRRTEMQKQIALPPRLRPPSQAYQLAFPISDETVLFDSLKLFLSYLDRAPGYHTMAERDRIEAFLRSLTSLVFAIPVSVLDAMLTPVQDDNGSGSNSDEGDTDGLSDSAASSIDQRPGSTKIGQAQHNQTAAVSAKKAADLRKKVLKIAGGEVQGTGKVDGERTPLSSRDSTPVPNVQAATGTSLAPALMASGPQHIIDTNVPELYPVEGENRQILLEKSTNGDSSFKNDVPTSAAGLDGMQGVETIQTHSDGGHRLRVDGIYDQAVEERPGTDPAASLDNVIEAGSSNMPLGSALAPAASLQTSSRQIRPNPQQYGTSPPMLQPAQPYGQPQIRRFNFFCNTPYYCAIRLLHLLYSRLQAMKEAARALTYTLAKDALTNTSYTAFGKANPRFAGQEANSAIAIYDSMLELCEKLFGSEVDQATFEDGIRHLFGNRAYQVFTIDKVLSALVKTVWSLIDSNREAYSSNGEIFKLLVDDRRYPTTAQAQQISYRVNAELAAGSEENLYRVEWMPRRHLLSFQLLGKDEVLPEDEGDLSKVWERYIETFLNDENTKDLAISVGAIKKNAYSARNLKISHAASLPQLIAKSELESRICMRSYRMFWQARTEDAMHRAWEDDGVEKLENVNAHRRQGFQQWIIAKETSRMAVEQKMEAGGAVQSEQPVNPDPVMTSELKESTLFTTGPVPVGGKETSRAADNPSALQPATADFLQAIPAASAASGKDNDEDTTMTAD